MLIRGAEVAGRGGLDVQLEGERIAAIGVDLPRRRDEPVLEARGGALLPGLHDHHLHLHALAAAARSVDCGPPAVEDEGQLAAVLGEAAARGRGWLRGVGYHESVAGPLDRERLDAWVPDRPLRLQHRSGALWMLNGAALDALGGGGELPDGLERDAAGRPNGRLFRADAWLRAQLADDAPELADVGARLAATGLTGLTDATPHTDASTLGRLAEAAATGALPQRLLVLGEPGLPATRTRRAARGAVKLMLDEPRLPAFETLCERIRTAHAEERGVAVHCVTRVELQFAVAAFREAGARAGDRLEHAAVAPPELVRQVAALPLAVVTQPHFVAERGDVYRAEVAPGDLPWLYRARGWLEAGVPLAGGSDAPFGSPDPWRAIAAAVRRVTPGGARLGPEETLDPEQALALYTSEPGNPGGPPRRLGPGAAADLCLLDRPWRDARERLVAADVAATWCGGRLVWDRDRASA